MESRLFSGIILLVAILAKNQSLTIVTVSVLITKLTPASRSFLPWLQGRGVNIGATIITAAILTPIATGEIDLRDLLEAFKSPIGWVAVSCDGLVATLSSRGIGLIASDLQITVALVFGTILGIVSSRGIATGLVIASGITHRILRVFVLGKQNKFCLF